MAIAAVKVIMSIHMFWVSLYLNHWWYGSVPITDTENTDPASDDKPGESEVIWEINNYLQSIHLLIHMLC